MKILTLILSNFKGAKAVTADFQGKNATVLGSNETGKTTLFDAFLWLLFSKDSEGAKAFGVKPVDAPKGVEVEVTGTFEVDGKTVELKKVLRENWVKPRGKLEAEYAGDVTLCYVDGVPYKVTEYASYIKTLCDEEVFKLLTNPLYFNKQLKWTDRRRILFEICGEVGDEDVFASKLSEYARAEQGVQEAIKALQVNTTDAAALEALQVAQGRLSELAGYKLLKEAMGEHSFEDYKKILAEQRKRINKELELLPVRIDEAAKTIVEVDAEVANSRAAELQGQLDSENAELSKVQSGGAEAEANAQLLDLQTELRRMTEDNRRHRADQEEAHRQKVSGLLEGIYAEHNKAREQHDRLRGESFGITDNLSKTYAKLTRCRQQLREAMGDVWDKPTACPTCGQSLPAKQIEVSKAEFEKRRQEAIRELEASQEALATEAKKYETHRAEVNAHIDEMSLKIARLDTSKVQIEIENPLILTNLEGYIARTAELETKIADATAALQKIKDEKSGRVADLKEKLATLNTDLTEQQDILAQSRQNAESQKRIADYEAQQKDYARQHERNEQLLFYCDLFTKAKVAQITDRVNEKFKIARFKLFDVQINGGITDCCEVTVNGVEFGDLNNGARCNVGLDIIATLQQHYGFAPPLFVDDAEYVNVPYKLPSQVIQLVNPPKFELIEQERRNGLLAEHSGDYAAAELAYFEQYRPLRVVLKDE